MSRAATPSVAVNLPLRGLTLAEHRGVLDRLVDAGVRDVWADEFNGVDAIAALATFAAWRSEITITSAITNVFTRGPGLLAMSAATLAAAAPGRATFGIGASSKVVVESWNGIRYERPYARVAETLMFLRDVLQYGRTTRAFGDLGVEGFRLPVVPEQPPRLAVGALGPRMQHLAAGQADTMITGMLGAADIPKIRDHVARADRQLPDPLKLHVGVFVIPPGEPAAVEAAARRHLTGYLPVPAYASFQHWLGRGGALAEMNERWKAGDRRGAVEALPGDVVSDLVVTGSFVECVAGVRAYLDAGVDGLNLMIPATAEVTPTGMVHFLCDLVDALDRRET